MKTIHLKEPWIQRLANMPESGMGYQKVDITLKGNRILENVLVLNAEDCQTDEKFNPEDVVDIKLHPKNRACED
jgi:hypothetical protein